MRIIISYLLSVSSIAISWSSYTWYISFLLSLAGFIMSAHLLKEREKIHGIICMVLSMIGLFLCLGFGVYYSFTIWS